VNALLVSALLGLLLAGGALALWAAWIEPRSLTVTRLEIASPAWRGSAGALRIALLSDLHAAGPHDLPARYAQVVARVNAEGPDLVLLLGDYVGRHRVKTASVAPEVIAPVLGRLRAPLGVYAVLGNHDWRSGGARVARALAAAGIEVLDNAARRLRREGGDCWLLGVGDASLGADRLAATLAQVTDDAPALLMTHSPDLFPEVPARIALSVAGHTHGGQVRLPLVGALYVPSRYGLRYAYGHLVEDGRHRFVTRGLGHSVLPIRFLCPPEIVVITLRAASDAQADAASTAAMKASSLTGSRA
jgi:predicted MPP superfamily phosphohydrolase